MLAIRLGVLFGAATLLWMLESRFPLFAQDRRGHAASNLTLTALTLAVYAALGGVSTAVSLATAPAGVLAQLQAPALAGVLGIVALDLFSYLAHRSMHAVPALWRVHRVHHCDAAVDVTTTFRQHPLESLWRVAWQVAAIALFGIGPVAVLVYLSLSSLNALLEHANVRVPARLDSALQRAWVTPNMHKWHHSREAVETDSNYGNLLSLWDRGLKTWTAPRDMTALRYGLAQHEETRLQTFGWLLRLPFAA